MRGLKLRGPSVFVPGLGIDQRLREMYVLSRRQHDLKYQLTYVYLLFLVISRGQRANECEN